MKRDSVTHQFNNRGGALRRIVNFGFLTELMAANTHPTPKLGVSVHYDLCFCLSAIVYNQNIIILGLLNKYGRSIRIENLPFHR